MRRGIFAIFGNFPLLARLVTAIADAPKPRRMIIDTERLIPRRHPPRPNLSLHTPCSHSHMRITFCGGTKGPSMGNDSRTIILHIYIHEQHPDRPMHVDATRRPSWRELRRATPAPHRACSHTQNTPTDSQTHSRTPHSCRLITSVGRRMGFPESRPRCRVTHSNNVFDEATANCSNPFSDRPSGLSPPIFPHFHLYLLWRPPFRCAPSLGGLNPAPRDNINLAATTAHRW